MYHLATADVGKFNGDTTGFYVWLQRYLVATDDASAQKITDHINQQVYAAIYQPDTEVAQRLRLLDAGADPVLSPVPQANGEATRGPVVYILYLSLPKPIHQSFMRTGLFSISTQALSDYQASKITNPNKYTGFADYLVEIKYGKGWLYDIDQSYSTPQPQPTSTSHSQPTPRPTTTSNSATTANLPAEGSILYQRPLTEWLPDDIDLGWFAVANGTFHIGVHGGDGHTIAPRTERADFGDISASVDLREVTDHTASVG